MDDPLYTQKDIRRHLDMSRNQMKKLRKGDYVKCTLENGMYTGTPVPQLPDPDTYDGDKPLWKSNTLNKWMSGWVDTSESKKCRSIPFFPESVSNSKNDLLGNLGPINKNNVNLTHGYVVIRSWSCTPNWMSIFGITVLPLENNSDECIMIMSHKEWGSEVRVYRVNYLHIQKYFEYVGTTLIECRQYVRATDGAVIAPFGNASEVVDSCNMLVRNRLYSI